MREKKFNHWNASDDDRHNINNMIMEYFIQLLIGEKKTSRSTFQIFVLKMQLLKKN